MKKTPKRKGKNTSLGFRWAGFDATRNILINYSCLRFVSAFTFVPMTLLMAHILDSSIPYLFLLLGVTLSTVKLIYCPNHPFFISEVWGPKMRFEQLNETARRVITFLRSSSASGLLLRIAAIHYGLIALFWFVSLVLLEQPILIRPNTQKDVWAWSLTFCLLLSAVGTFGTQIGFLFHYALKHWDEIQKTYEPWPVDKPFNPAWRDIFKRGAWKRLYHGSRVASVSVPHRTGRPKQDHTLLTSCLGLSGLILLDAFFWGGQFDRSLRYGVLIAGISMMMYAWNRNLRTWLWIVGGVALSYSPLFLGIGRWPEDLVKLATAVALPLVAWGMERRK